MRGDEECPVENVEGGELAVLSGIDHEKTRFRFLLIESRSPTNARTYLGANGYDLVTQLSTWLRPRLKQALSVADMAHDTVLRLTQVPGIVGIKEATGNIERAQWLIREVHKSFAVYSGDDGTAVALMLCGGKGNVSVTANVAPRQMHELCVAAIAGDAQRAMAIQLALLPLHRHLFVEPNPIPVKWAMAQMNRCGPTMRLPMTGLAKNHHAVVHEALRSCGLL